MTFSKRTFAEELKKIQNKYSAFVSWEMWANMQLQTPWKNDHDLCECKLGRIKKKTLIHPRAHSHTHTHTHTYRRRCAENDGTLEIWIWSSVAKVDACSHALTEVNRQGTVPFSCHVDMLHINLQLFLCSTCSSAHPCPSSWMCSFFSHIRSAFSVLDQVKWHCFCQHLGAKYLPFN